METNPIYHFDNSQRFRIVELRVPGGKLEAGQDILLMTVKSNDDVNSLFSIRPGREV